MKMTILCSAFADVTRMVGLLTVVMSVVLLDQPRGTDAFGTVAPAAAVGRKSLSSASSVTVRKARRLAL
jgi:hypothetical protein